MFCNYTAYDSFIKYIPYDEVIIKENRNDIKFWTAYKMDCMKSVDDDLIHVDPDVFIWDDIFRNFIEGHYDVMVQDILPADKNKLKKFVEENLEFFIDSKILTKPYDGCCASCGVLGMRKNMQEYYFAGVDVMRKAIENIGADRIEYPSIILEELLVYLIAVENDFKLFEILPHELIIKFGVDNVGSMFNYTHVWMRHKYRKKVIDEIKRKILFEFSEYQNLVLKYESDVLINKNIIFPDENSY
jgi:hypothetical protein